MSEGGEMVPNGGAEPSRDLYTIPFSSNWFQWDEIHETEKQALPEFFQGVSTTKNPRVYKEYRDFIINKYREDTSKQLTFTEVRKALIGDVSLLKKLFSFLEECGLINFVVAVKPSPRQDRAVETKVLVEEGTPHGLRVVLAPTLAPPQGKVLVEKKLIGGENGLKPPPLTSYCDVYGEWDPRKGALCGLCGEQCLGGHNKNEDGIKTCFKCSKSKNGDKEEAQEAKPASAPAEVPLAAPASVPVSLPVPALISVPSLAWTDSETLLLLEGVLKHGDDWDLIAQHVRTRNKTECIARLIQLPFGEHIVSPTNGKSFSRLPITPSKTVEIEMSKKPVEYIETNGEVSPLGKTSEEPPSKKRRVASYISATDSIIQQVALLSAICDPRLTAAAADAAITELCNESDHAREVFDKSKSEVETKFTSSNQEPMSTMDVDGEQPVPQVTDVIETPSDESEEKFITIAYQIRAAVAATIGATAARAKLLADHEESEMKLLMATIIEAQMRKIQHKMKHFSELEAMMDEEYDLLQQQKRCVVREWVGLLQQAFHTGVPKWKDNTVTKPLIVSSTP